MQREAESAGWSGGGRGEPPSPHCPASAQAEATGSAEGAVGQGQVPGWSPAPLARPWGPRGSACKLPSRQLVRGEGTLISHRPLPAPSCSEGANGPRLQPSREGNLSPPFRRALTRGGWRGPHNPAQEDLGTVHGSPWPGGREPWELLGHVGTSGVPTPPAPCPQSEPGSALGMVAPPARSVLGLAKGLDGERRGKQPQQPTSACVVMPGQDHAAVGCPLCWWDAPAVLGVGGGGLQVQMGPADPSAGKW